MNPKHRNLGLLTMFTQKLLAPFAAVGLCLIGCTQSPRIDTHAEQDAVRSVDAQWASAIRAKEVDKIMGFFAPDAVAIDANVPLRTDHQSIRKAYETWLADNAVSSSFASTLDAAEVSSSGDLAYTRGINRWSETTPEGRVKHVAKFVTIYRKIGGTWKAVVDIGAADTPLPLR